MNTNDNFQDRLAFARHNFDNLQSLIRFSDTKAAAILTLIIFLAASGLQVAKDAAARVNWHSCRSTIASDLLILAGVVFFAAFARIVWMVHKVLRPRGARGYHSPKPRTDFMWQDHVLAHGTQDAYAEAINSASADLLLKNVTDQIFALASISKEKMDAIIAAHVAIWAAFGSWLAALILSLLIVRWD